MLKIAFQSLDVNIFQGTCLPDLQNMHLPSEHAYFALSMTNFWLRPCVVIFRRRDGLPFIVLKFSLLISNLERYYIHVNDACKLRFNIKWTNSLLKEGSRTFFLIKDKLICFLFKYSLLGQQG